MSHREIEQGERSSEGDETWGRPAGGRRAGQQEHDASPQGGSDYGDVRRAPLRSAPDAHGVGPGGYTPRESEQQFGAAYDERNQGGYGQTYGSGSAAASQGRGAEPGSHRGRGPKGFVRSDARILDDLHDRLTEDPELDASDISVSIAQGVVTLEGQIQERWMKHRAEDIAAHCGGVSDVLNRLKVMSGPPPRSR